MNLFIYFVGDFGQTTCHPLYNLFREWKMLQTRLWSDHNTGHNVPYSFQAMSGFFNVPYQLISNKGYETGPPIYSPYPRRPESLGNHLLV